MSNTISTHLQLNAFFLSALLRKVLLQIQEISDETVRKLSAKSNSLFFISYVVSGLLHLSGIITCITAIIMLEVQESSSVITYKKRVSNTFPKKI